MPEIFCEDCGREYDHECITIGMLVEKCARCGKRINQFTESYYIFHDGALGKMNEKANLKND